ncbi:MAG: ferritin-like domain-containing protein [Actinomycetota bacterium]|nr:ferritin-like domain-containing protein [Actinomycetota bacterium]
MSGTDPTDAAVQTALAAEHAAIYAYGVCGGVLDAGTAGALMAREAFAVHQQRREGLESLLRDHGLDPVPAASGYALPRPVTGQTSAARLAQGVEERCGAVYAALVAASSGSTRRSAIGWLSDAATRGLDWGASATAFPGLVSP